MQVQVQVQVTNPPWPRRFAHEKTPAAHPHAVGGAVCAVAAAQPEPERRPPAAGRGAGGGSAADDRWPAPAAGAHPPARHCGAPDAHGGGRFAALERGGHPPAAFNRATPPPIGLCACAAESARPERAGGAGHHRLHHAQHGMGRTVAGPQHAAAACAGGGRRSGHRGPCAACL